MDLEQIYRETRSVVILDIETWAVGGVQLTESLYHPCIFHYTYLMRGGSLDYYLVLGCLHISTPAAHSHFLRKRTHFPIKTLTTRTGSTAYLLISAGTLPIHLVGTASFRRGYHRKPGVSSTPGLRHSDVRNRGAPEHSAA